MKILKIFNPENCSEAEAHLLPVINKARAIVFDENQDVVLVHVGKYNYIQEPGGGIETGESFEDALRRECLEEIGVVIKDDIRPLGITETWRPSEGYRSISHGFIAFVDSYIPEPLLTEEEREENFTVMHLPVQDAIDKIKSNLESLETEIIHPLIQERALIFLREVVKII